jgi:predicted nucleic acid-binding protein
MERLDLGSIPEGVSITIDTAPIIYFLEGREPLASGYAPLFEWAAQGRNGIVVSAITLAEVMAGPLANGRPALAKTYRHALTEGPGCSLVVVDAEIAETAAAFRAKYRLKLPDAIQLATAVVSGSRCLVTHDRDFSLVKDVTVVSASVDKSQP